MMHYADTRDRSGELLRLALGLMSAHNIPADPVSYTVLYDHVSGRNSALSNDIEAFLKKHTPLSSSLLKDLYTRHIADRDRIISEKLLREVKGILSEISKFVIETQGDISGHGKRLENLAHELSRASDLDTIGKTVDQLIQTARNLGKSGETLQGKMTSSSGDLELLRKRLEKSKQEAMTDTLTGISNRRGFDRFLKQQTNTFALTGQPFCLVLIDLDHFKAINDTYGHLVGDSILRGLAGLLKEKIGKKALLARFGGDEFVIVIPGVSLDAAKDDAEAVRQNLACREWKEKGSGRSMGKLTLSMGISQYRPGDTPDTFIQRADAALYAAKQQGRDRVVVADEDTAEAMRA